MRLIRHIMSSHLYAVGMIKYMLDIDMEFNTPIQDLGDYKGNHLYIKREDMIPFSFGGNKARKAKLFFCDIDKGNYDCVVTYGSSSSNHCRIIANECCRRGMECYIISPEEASESTFNSQMMGLFGAKITIVPVSSVHETIKKKIKLLIDVGKAPYFIEGGGHGNIGTEAYVQCYQEIKAFEETKNIHFDYVFLASGTGTTQAGLVCGQLMNDDDRQIIGISIARKNPRGRDIVIASVKEYLNGYAIEEKIKSATIFIDEYTLGYGECNLKIKDTIDVVLKRYGIPLDTIYTGKAFAGMTDYIKKIDKKNLLFIHTGGTPLFFDALRSLK